MAPRPSTRASWFKPLPPSRLRGERAVVAESPRGSQIAPRAAGDLTARVERLFKAGQTGAAVSRPPSRFCGRFGGAQRLLARSADHRAPRVAGRVRRSEGPAASQGERAGGRPCIGRSPSVPDFGGMSPRLNAVSGSAGLLERQAIGEARAPRLRAAAAGKTPLPVRAAMPAIIGPVCAASALCEAGRGTAEWGAGR